MPAGRAKPHEGGFAQKVLGVSNKRTQMGQVSALIDEIVSVEDVFRELFEGGQEHVGDVASRFEEIAQPVPPG